MIPVNTHLETVKMAHQKRVKKAMVKDLDNMFEFDPEFVAAISRSEIPYELAKSQDVFSFDKSSPRYEPVKRSSTFRGGYEPVHHCGNAVPIPREPGVKSKEVINHWHNYYTKMKAKRNSSKKLPDAVPTKQVPEFPSRDTETFNELKWDEYALSLVGKNMQEFIVFRLTNKSASDYHRLSRSFISRHGRPKELDKIELIDDLFDEEQKVTRSGDRPKWLKDELARLLPAVSAEASYNIKELPDGRISAIIDKKQERPKFTLHSVRPRLSKSTSAIDKISKKSSELEELAPRPRSASPLPKFSKELVSGARQLFSSKRPNHIQFSSGHRFHKKLQPIFPNKDVVESHAIKNGRPKSSVSLSSRAPSRGHRRWIKEPDYLEDGAGFVNKPYEYSEDDAITSASGELSVLSGEFGEKRHLSGREGTQSRMENSETTSMRAEMAADWRNKWRVNLADTVDPNELLNLLSDLQPFTRIRGIVSITYIAHGKHSSNCTVPGYLLKAIEYMLTDDTDINVRKAAAISLSSLGRFSHNVKAILLDIIRSESSDSTDKWSAAQGLAHNQVYTSDVISVFVRIYVDNYSPDGTDDPRRETALKLIRVISSGTALAAGMAGELLSNSDWEIRRSACHVLGACHGPLPADVVSKLNQLMWADWSEEVRLAAARALGQAGHGLDVHHELLAKLQSKNGSDRTRALRLIAIVGFMTVRMMPLYLECFRDTYTDVREAACSVAARLFKLATRTKTLLDISICERLMEIIQFDTAPAVRVTAISALENCLRDLDAVDPPPMQSTSMSALFRTVPTENQKLREKIYACLVWSIQTAPEKEVRLKALIILRDHKYGDAEYAEILRQRLLAEQSEDVRKELEESLEDCLRRVHSASRSLPLLGDLRKNIQALSHSTTGIVARLEKVDQRERLRDFKSRFLVSEEKPDK